MGQQVDFERRLHGEGFLADGAFVGLESGVQHVVPGHVLSAHERLVALGALEGGGALVDVLHVHVQAGFAVKGLAAEVAGESVFAWKKKTQENLETRSV